MRPDAAIDDCPQWIMCNVTGHRAVIVILGDDDVGGLFPAELAELFDDPAQDLVVHPGRVDRVVRSRPVRVIRGVRLLRPEDRQVRLLVGQDVIHEHIGQVSEAAPGQRAAAVERIAGLSILEPLNGNWSGRVAVVVRERQRTRLVGVDAVPRKRITGLLQFLGESERHRRIFIEDDPAALVILDEGGSELADGRRRQPFGLCGLQHGRNERELALVGVAHGFDHAEILDERRRGKIDIGSLRVLSLARTAHTPRCRRTRARPDRCRWRWRRNSSS